MNHLNVQQKLDLNESIKKFLIFDEEIYLDEDERGWTNSCKKINNEEPTEFFKHYDFLDKTKRLSLYYTGEYENDNIKYFEDKIEDIINKQIEDIKKMNINSIIENMENRIIELEKKNKLNDIKISHMENIIKKIIDKTD